MAALNYAKDYQQALEQEFPYVLYFGALFATPNNGRYRWVNSNVIEIPTISTTGRVDGNRDAIGQKKRNYNEYFDELFGAGTAEKVFHKNNNLGIRMEGFAQVTALSGEAKAFMDDLSAKYGAGRVQNRQQRRAEQRKGGKNKHQNRNNFNAVDNG